MAAQPAVSQVRAMKNKIKYRLNLKVKTWKNIYLTHTDQMKYEWTA